MENQPMSSILVITLKRCVGSKIDLLMRWAFGVIRDLHNEKYSNKSPVNFKQPRKSFETTKAFFQETPKVSKHGDIVHKTTKYTKKTIVKNRSISPLQVDHQNTSEKYVKNQSEATPITLKKHVLKFALKAFTKHLTKHFNKFRQSLFNEGHKHSAIKGLMQILLKKIQKNGFDPLFYYTKSLSSSRSDFRRNSIKSAILISEDIQILRPNFNDKDKELWKNQHPIYKHSPTPSELSHPSLSNYSENFQVNLFTDNFTRVESRRNTTGTIKGFDTFGTVISDDNLPEPLSSISKESNDKPNTGIRQNKHRLLRSEKSPRSCPPVKAALYMEKLIKHIGKNHNRVKVLTMFNLAKAVNENKSNKKFQATGGINDVIQKHNKKLKEYAFESIKEEKENKKTLGLARGHKKQILRSQKNQKPPTQLGEEFAYKLDFLNTLVLKNKLMSFLAIIEASPNTTIPYETPAYKNSLKFIFRLLETKKFLKLFSTFHTIKKKSEHKNHAQHRKALKFLQKLENPINKYYKRQKNIFIKKVKSIGNYTLGAKKMLGILSKIVPRVFRNHKMNFFMNFRVMIQRRRQNIILRIMKAKHILRRMEARKMARAYVKWETFLKRIKRANRPKLKCSGNLSAQRFMEKTTFKNFSPIPSLTASSNFKVSFGDSAVNFRDSAMSSSRSRFTSGSPLRILPRPRNIHDYIDDFYEISKSKIDSAYLTPTSTQGSFFSVRRSK
ncbi:hypothetical protein SteCoe_31679 [Stentor coeruleus]|uniref:Uncharacterized protein n=1 Tax=Stentor coeruleus TaxID=5963 RepID=A0A1R2B0R1_9CILI|nr:hypothetical protein SteCoe_31679 [Stentor coeruleus]